MPSIGFVLLTHGNEPQILRLTDTLNQMFGDPPIACHHDFSKLALNKRQFPGNVHFVEPHVRTSWGTISLVHAMLKALRLLYDTSAPDWFYLLSGSDYPIRDAASIRNELAHSPFDAYIRLNKIDHTTFLNMLQKTRAVWTVRAISGSLMRDTSAAQSQFRHRSIHSAVRQPCIFIFLTRGCCSRSIHSTRNSIAMPAINGSPPMPNPRPLCWLLAMNGC